MTISEALRILVFACGTLILIGCLAEMWHGPRRGMYWSQFLRYSSLLIIVSTVMAAQWERRYVHFTGYTIMFAIGTLIGSMGVAPQLQTPMRKAR